MQSLSNFGRNIAIAPREVFTPRSEAEVLDILARCRGRKIRVIGRLHSWSDILLTEDVLLDLRHMNSVQVAKRDGGNWVTVGAGCQIKRLLTELERQGNWTTPSLGLITEQAIAGGDFDFADLLCHTMGLLFDARPHWGKYCPLTGAEAIRLYPNLPRFRQV